MECIEAKALKSSFLKEFGSKSTQQTLFEDLWCVAGIDNVVNVSPDEFSVDDLLDLSDKDFNNSDGGCFEEYSEEDEEKDSMISSHFSSTGDLVSLPAGEIHLPVITTWLNKHLFSFDFSGQTLHSWFNEFVNFRDEKKSNYVQLFVWKSEDDEFYWKKYLIKNKVQTTFSKFLLQV